MNLRVHFAKPMFDDKEYNAVSFILKKRSLTCAGQVKAFEEQFENWCGGGKAVAVSSCMAALHLSYLARGIGPGDEVLCPALTHVATAHAIEAVGATPVFIDAHIESGNMDPDLVAKAITRKTKAVSVVHFLGQPAYMRSTLALARAHDLYVVEDCALALGTHHWDTHVGLIGDVGCFSFYPCKHITTGEGGMLLTKDPTFAEQLMRARSFGLDSEKRAVGLGLNYRMTEIQGILGQEQLAKANWFLTLRRRNAEFLRKLLFRRGFRVIGGDYALSVFVPEDINRDRVRQNMAVEGRVETSVYYTCAVPDHPYYAHKYPGWWDVPVARKICAETITLSVGPHLRKPEMQLIADTFTKAVEKCALHSSAALV